LKAIDEIVFDLIDLKGIGSFGLGPLF